MTTAGDIVDRIKSDLVINGTDYDNQILAAIQSALRELRGSRYWFLEEYTTSISTSTSSESVALPSDFSALKSVDLIANGTRYTDDYGFMLVTFDKLRAQYWYISPLQTGVPIACAVQGSTLYLSHLAQSTYTLPMVYYKQDVTLPTAGESSVWFDDGYDVVRTKAQFIFKRDAQGYTATEEDGSMVAIAIENLNKTHNSHIIGR